MSLETKDKIIEEAKDTLASQVAANEKAFKKERNKERGIHVEKIMIMQEMVNQAMDEGFKSVFDDFEYVVDYVEMLNLGIVIP